MITQRLVNGQMTITTFAKYSITNTSAHYTPKFEPCFDSYDQFVYLITEEDISLNPSFDLYEQQICNS